MQKSNETSECKTQRIAQTSSVESELIEICSSDHNDKIKWLAASNPSLSSDTLLHFLRSGSQVLRDGASANPALTSQVVKLAGLTPNCEAWLYIADNPQIEVDLLKRVVAESEDSVIRRHIKNRIAEREGLSLAGC